jgi:hypothetical protein
MLLHRRHRLLSLCADPRVARFVEDDIQELEAELIRRGEAIGTIARSLDVG